MTNEADLKVGLSMLEDVLHAADGIEYPALAIKDVLGKEAWMSSEDQGQLSTTVEQLLKRCEAIEGKLAGADNEVIAGVNFAKGRLYAVYIPLKMLPIMRYKSHKDQAIACYNKALELSSSAQLKGMTHYFLAQLHDVWGERDLATSNLEQVVALLGVDDPNGMRAAKQLEELKAQKKKGCFIATAAYGSPLAEEVCALRRLRDDVLEQSRVGSWLVRFYYRVSPPVARRIQDSRWAMTVARCLLTPVVLFVRWSRGE